RDLDGVLQVLGPAGHVDGPGGVAEVAAQLTGHGGHGEGRKGGAVVGVVALDRLEQAEHRDLHEVVERLALVLEAARAMEREPSVIADDLIAQRAVAGGAVAPEAFEVGRTHGRVHGGVTSRRGRPYTENLTRCAAGW